MTTQQQYTLKEARTILGLSEQGLSKESGISLSAINSIENGGAYKTNVGVAIALAETLGLELDEILWPRGLSHLGRPPKTGKPITFKRKITLTMTEELTVTSGPALCPKHNIVLLATGLCDYCT